MIKFRILATVILMAAVLSVGLPIAAEAQTPPMLCFCTVYEDGVLVGAGYNVSAYLEGTTGGTVRVWELTDADGECELWLFLTVPELLAPEAVTFKVDGVPAATTPEVVSATLAPTYPRLDVFTGTPVPTATATATPAATATPTATPTATAISTGTPAPTPTLTVTPTASPTHNATPTPTVTPTPTPGGGGLSGGAIAGIVIGSLIALGLVVWVMIRRRKKS